MITIITDKMNVGINEVFAIQILFPTIPKTQCGDKMGKSQPAAAEFTHRNFSKNFMIEFG
jgi:hypothetical protein